VFGLLTAQQSQQKLVALWDAASGEPIARRALSTSLFDQFAAVSPDGRLVARETTAVPATDRGGGDLPGATVAEVLGRQFVVLEDTVMGLNLLRLNQPDYLQHGSVVFTPDGKTLVTWTSTHPPRGPDGEPPGTTTVRLWELRSGKQRLAFALPIIGKRWEFEPQAIAMSADGQFLAAARPDKTISVWDLTIGAEVAKRSGYGAVVGSLAFRPDGKALASGHAPGRRPPPRAAGGPPAERYRGTTAVRFTH
jgi:WD40 repeat protein